MHFFDRQNQPSAEPRPRRFSVLRRRPGSIYVVVLLSAMLIGVIGAAALSRSRVEFRAARASRDFQQARFLARAGIDIGAELIAAVPSWRTASVGGRWITRSGIGGGQFDLYGSDPVDGDFANNTTDPVRLVSVSRVGSAAFGWQVDLRSVDEPLVAFQSAIHAAGDVTVKSGQKLTLANAPVTTNASLLISGTVTGAAEGMAFSGSGTVTGGLRVPTTVRAGAPASIIDVYAAKGTPISYDAFAGGTIQQTVITRALNPFGKPNKNGVYVIDTGGKDLTLRKLRFEGTLVIRARGKKLYIEDNVNLRNYVATYPTLVVDGEIEFKLKSNVQIVELTQGINFNPPGAPYGGATDSDLLDSYPCEINGFVYATEGAKVREITTINGAVLLGTLLTLEVGGDLTVNYDNKLVVDAPEGFVAPGPMRPVDGSWQRVNPLP